MFGGSESVLLALTSIGLLAGVAADAALNRYSPSKLEDMLGADRQRLRRITDRLKDFDELTGAVHLWNVIFLVLFVLAAAALFDAPHLSVGRGFFFVAGMLTITGFGFFGVIRGAVAEFPERALLRLLGFIRFVDRLLYPLTRPIAAGSALLSRAFGAEQEEGTEEEEAMEEILDAVAEGEAEGVIQQSTADIIENLIEYKDLVVREIMTPRTAMVCLRQQAPFEDIIRTIGQHGHSRYPVYNENRDNIVGMLYVLDVFKHYDKVKRGETSIGGIMRKAIMVPETKRVDDLLQEFRTNRVHIAVVVDEFGGTSGLVTVQDIVGEIVGDLEDEFGKGKKMREIHRVDDHRIEIDAKLPVEDLNEQLQLSLPSDVGYETVGGFLAAALGKVPATGENFEVDGVRFEIVDADERRAKRIRVTMNAGS